MQINRYLWREFIYYFNLLGVVQGGLILSAALFQAACADTAAPASAPSVAPAQPVIRIFELRIKPEKLSAFNELGRHNITRSVQTERGVLAMYALADAQDPAKIYVFEAYADQAAYEAHRQSPHFRRWLDDAKDMILERKVSETRPVVFGSKVIPVWGGEAVFRQPEK